MKPCSDASASQRPLGMIGAGAQVHTLRQGKRDLDHALAAVWRDLDGLGWLSISAPHVVVQVGQRWRSDLVLQTARSLATLLADRLPAARVDVLDHATPVVDSRAPVARGDEVGPITVAGTAVNELVIPGAWFGSFFLVTVTGAGPDAVTRMSAVLDAQAEPLRRPGGLTAPMSAAYEAHRLFASDLVVAAVRSRQDDTTSEPCWFASPSDVAVEIALARANGCDPMHLPFIEMLARHELLPSVTPSDDGPTLNGYVAPAWRARMHAATANLAATQLAVRQDVSAVRRNLRRIPPALRRRWSNWKRENG